MLQVDARAGRGAGRHGERGGSSAGSRAGAKRGNRNGRGRAAQQAGRRTTPSVLQASLASVPLRLQVQWRHAA